MDFARRVKPKKRRTAVVFVLGLSAAFAVVSAAGAYRFVKNLPDPQRLSDRAVVQSTRIYDRTGLVLLYEIHGEEKRTVIPYEQAPERVKQATLVAEDINFYRHHGIDWRGIARAFRNNLRRGDITQGGSTITQQLVKNSLLGGEKTYARKLKEAITAVLLEQKYSKDEIFGLYLNQIPYGSNAYGIAAAAETYFAKPVDRLTVTEAAALAALPKAPTYFSPYGLHKDELIQRIGWIIDRMREAGFITPEQAADAKASPPMFVPPKRAILAPHFVLHVREYLNQKYGEEFVERGGLRVITTLDWRLQEAAEQAVIEGAKRNEELVGAKNAALVALDPKAGDILAMVGSRDYFDVTNDGNVNVTTRPRQPGSAFKPFVYATAFKKGYTPETVLFDAPTEFNPLCNPDGTPGPGVEDPKTCYHPSNYDDTFRGPVSLRQALAQSLNLPSVKLLYLAGVNDSIKTSQEMGITTLTDPARYGLSLVLGGAEVTLLEMTSAHGASSQHGIMHPSSALMRLETPPGAVPEEKREASLPALDTQIARTINGMLSDNNARVPVFRPNSSLFFPNRQVAAKTGTTQDYRDAWTIGYTPSLVAGVWVGNNDNSPMNQGRASVMVAAPIWRQFMNFVLADTPAEEFPQPEQTRAQNPVLRGLWRSGPPLAIDKISGKRAIASTPPELIEEVTTGSIVSILGLIKKDDPNGDQPSQTDPQFKNWQAGIEQWLAGHSLPPPPVPDGFDDVHTLDKQPRMGFPAFENNESGLAQVGAIAVSIQAAFPLRELLLFVNDELAGSKTAPILGTAVNFPLAEPLAPGEYMIRASAYDAVGNRASAEKRITIIP